MRHTRVSRCGFPQEGPGGIIVTKGFVTATLTPSYKDANDLEQENADGELCVTDRTPPSLKWFDVEVVYCAVDPELLNMAAGYPIVADYAGKPVGFRIEEKIDVDSAFAFELWSGVPGEDCELPEEGQAPVQKFGYTLLPAVVESTLQNIEFGAKVSTFTLKGRTAAGLQWGRGPFDVVSVDAANTPGRLDDPMGREQHLHMQTTTIGPPAVTDGAVPLAMPTPYYTAPVTP